MHLNDNISQCLGIQRKKGQKYGIELEYENYGGHVGACKYWKVDRDGSLRNNGIEFVSNVLSQTQLPLALKEAQTMVDNGPKLAANDRCGVHVHLNMSDFSWAQLWNTVVLYTLAEPHIFAKYAPDRIDNHFCVPTFANTMVSQYMLEDIMLLRKGEPWEKPKPAEQDAEAVLIADYHHVDREQVVRWRDNDRNMYDQLLRQALGQPRERVQRVNRVRIPRAQAAAGNAGDFVQVFGEVEAPPDAVNRWLNPPGARPRNRPGDIRVLGTSKYCAVNFTRLLDLGTLEFRIAPATKDMKEVSEWANFLGNLQNQGNEFADPLDIIGFYEEAGMTGIRELLALPNARVAKQHQEDAEDAATFMAGYIPPEWNDLKWEAPQEVA